MKPAYWIWNFIIFKGTPESISVVIPFQKIQSSPNTKRNFILLLPNWKQKNRKNLLQCKIFTNWKREKRRRLLQGRLTNVISQYHLRYVSISVELSLFTPFSNVWKEWQLQAEFLGHLFKRNGIVLLGRKRKTIIQRHFDLYCTY